MLRPVTLTTVLTSQGPRVIGRKQAFVGKITTLLLWGGGIKSIFLGSEIPSLHSCHIVCFRPGNTSDAFRFLGYFFPPYLSHLILLVLASRNILSLLMEDFSLFTTLLKVFHLPLEFKF